LRLQASACPFKRRMLGSPPDDLVTVGYGGKGTARHSAVVQTTVQNQMPFAEKVDQIPELLAMTIEGHYDMTSCCSLLMKNTTSCHSYLRWSSRVVPEFGKRSPQTAFDLAP